jgi:preprotein translocase subunit SecG
MNISFYANIIQIIISASLVALILVQSKGSGVGSVFGGDSSIHKTRRGVEKTMHQTTIWLSLVFFVVSVLSVAVAA